MVTGRLVEEPRSVLSSGSVAELQQCQGGPVDSASLILFLPYPFSLSAYLSEKREREGQEKGREAGYSSS